MIITTPKAILSLYKNFDDGTFTPFSTACTLHIDYSTTCPTIKPATSYPDNYGGGCPPLTFAGYGMSGYVCYVGNEEGSTSVGRSADVYYTFSLPSGIYLYHLRFRYLAYGADGYDGGDTAVAEVLLFGSTIWSVGITRCTVSYGTANLSSTRSWGGGTTELRFRLRITGRVGWFDHRNFTIDDVSFTLSLPYQTPIISTPSINVLST